MKNFFKPEDFETAPTVFGDHRKAAEIANKKLNKLIQSWPVVWSMADDKVSAWWPNNPGYEISVKARLAFIEEIKKEPCQHEVIIYSRNAVFNTEGRLLSGKTRAPL
jgi:hypothetical protein